MTLNIDERLKVLNVLYLFVSCACVFFLAILFLETFIMFRSYFYDGFVTESILRIGVVVPFVIFLVLAVFIDGKISFLKEVKKKNIIVG